MYNIVYPLYSSKAIISSTKANLMISSVAPRPCLLLAKQSSIEIFTINPDSSINSLFELNIFADLLKIDTLPNINKNFPDFILLINRKYKFSVGNITNEEVTTNFVGNINSKYGEELPLHRQIFLHEQFNLPSKNLIKGYYGCYAYKDELRIIPYKINENGNIHINPVFTISLIEEFQYNIRDIIEFGISSTSNLSATKNEFLIGVLYVNKKQKDEKDDQKNSIFEIVKFEDIEGDAKHPSTGEEWILRFDEKIRKVIRVPEERAILAFSDKYIQYN
jgi:hypothetical protein